MGNHFNWKAIGLHDDATAEVGQTIRVKSVDENNLPTEWEAVDVPDKLSDFENDLFYNKKIPFLTLTKSDFQEWVDPDGVTNYMYTGSPKIDWVTSEKDIAFTVSATINGESMNLDSETETFVVQFEQEITDDGESVWYYGTDLFVIFNGFDFKNWDACLSKDEYTVQLFIDSETFAAATDLNIELFRVNKKIIDNDVLPKMVGMNVTGTEYTINDITVTANEGAEIFNNYANNIASGSYSHAEGHFTTAFSDYSHAEGGDTKAYGSYSHAEGYDTTAFSDYSHAEGKFTKASHGASHAEGSSTIASGDSSHAEGSFTTASGQYSHAEGGDTKAYGSYSHAEGKNTIAYGSYSHAEGNGGRYTKYITGDANATTYTVSNITNVNVGMSVLYNDIIAIITSIDKANKTITLDKTISDTACNKLSVVFGSCASGEYSHVEGCNTGAYDKSSHAEGHYTTASSEASHAEGYSTIASGARSHAEGNFTTASGQISHTEGDHTTASGGNSHAEGVKTIAAGTNQHAQGKYNIEDTDNAYAHIVGNGSSSARSNAHTLDWDGNAWFAGDVYVGSTSGTNKDEGSVKLIRSPATATVGQTIRVSAVDENGVPTAWEAFDPFVLTDESTGTKYKLTVVDSKLTMTEVTV